MLGYVCAYLRRYHPNEFIASLLGNAANFDDTANATELASSRKTPIISARYGRSQGNYFYDAETGAITKGTGSIKHLNAGSGKALYDLAHEKKHDTFIDLLLDITSRKILNARQLDILIKLDFFEAFGNMRTLLEIVRVFDFFKQGDAKTIKRELVSEETLNLYAGLVEDKTKTGAPAKSLKILNMPELLRRFEDFVRAKNLRDFTFKEKMANQLEYLGYIDLVTGKEEDRKKLVITDLLPLRSKKTGEIWTYIASAKSIGSGKESRWNVRPAVYKYKTFHKGDIVHCRKYTTEKARNGQTYLWLDVYEIVYE